MAIRGIGKILILVCLAFGFILSVQAAQAENPRKRFVASLGAYSAKTNTEVRLDATDGTAGTRLDFEDDLQLRDRETTPWLDFYARIGKRHRVAVTYYDLSRSGTQTLAGEIRVGDEVFPVSANVDSFFDSQIFRVAYGYSFSQGDKHEVGLLAGLHVAKIGLGVKTAGGLGLIAEEADATAPLPMFGLFGSVELPKKWRFRGWGQLFALEFENFDGSLYNITAVVEHDTFKNVGFGFGYSIFDFDLTADDDEFSGEFVYAFQGPTAYINLMF
jgi:hypothetical protein